MKLLILYRPNSEHARIVEEFAHEFGRRYPDKEIVLADADDGQWDTVLSTYDVVDYPALLVLAGDGQLQNGWQGQNLPTLQEVASYMVSE